MEERQDGAAGMVTGFPSVLSQAHPESARGLLADSTDSAEDPGMYSESE